MNAGPGSSLRQGGGRHKTTPWTASANKRGSGGGPMGPRPQEHLGPIFNRSHGFTVYRAQYGGSDNRQRQQTGDGPGFSRVPTRWAES